MSTAAVGGDASTPEGDVLDPLPAASAGGGALAALAVVEIAAAAALIVEAMIS